MPSGIPDEGGAARMALEELTEIEKAVAIIGPVMAVVLESRFERIRGYITGLDSLVLGYLRDESTRIDELGQKADLDEEARLQADLRAFRDRAAAEQEAGQGSLLPDEAPAHRDDP